MPTRKTTKPGKGRANAEETPPFGPDDYLSLNNQPAARSLPRELAERAELQRITIYAPGVSAAAKLFETQNISRSKDVPQAWDITLEREQGIGLPGRKATRMSPEEVIRGTKRTTADSGEPFRPEWVDYEPHPKISAERTTVLRRIDGTRLEPHYGVFGSDNRVVYYPSGYPWTCVGKVFTWTNFSNPSPAWYGSGVLIGGRVLLTAGHIVPWGSSNWAMQFIPGSYDGGSTLGPGVSSWVSDCRGYNTGNKVSAWDMAVCRLYTPLGDSYGYFGAKDYDSSWEGGNYWTLAGYPSAVAGGNRPSRQMWWPVLDDDGEGSAEEVEYEADATGGNSGGPAFGFWDGMPYAIATHSGGSKTTFLWWTIEDTNVGAGGGALVSLIKWARSNWP